MLYALREIYLAAMLTVQMGLGKNIERARRLAGFNNAAEFARLIGVSPTTLNDWESGRYKNLRLESVIRIAKGAACRVETLVVGFDTSYDRLWRKPGDLVSHDDHGSSPAAQSQPQLGGQSNDSTSSASSRVLAEDLKHIADLADDLKGAIQDVTHRLAGDVASTTDAHAARTDRGNAAGRVRRSRKAS